LSLADQPLSHLVSLAMGLLVELREYTLDVGRVLAGLLEVLLDGLLESLVCGVLDYLLLAHDEAMLGIVEFAEFVEEEFLCVSDRHVFEPSFR
jgi:hypothetical protein